MASFLSPTSDRRSRSKSPGGRERERSRSRDPSRSDDERDRRKSRSKKYSETESESESDSRRRSSRHEERRPSKKSYDPPSDDDRRRRGSKRVDESDDNRRERKHSSRKHDESEDDRKERRYSTRKYEEPVDDRRDKKKSSKSKKKSDSDSEEDDRRRRTKDKKKAAQSETDSSEEDDRRKSKSKSKSTHAPNGTGGQVPQYPPSQYGQPAPYGYHQSAYPPQPNAYGAPPPGAFPANNGWAPQPPNDPRYGPPSAGYANQPRAPSSAGTAYAQPDRYQYAQPNADVQYQYKGQPQRQPSYSKHYDTVDVQPAKSSREKVYMDDRYKRKEEPDPRKEKKSREDEYGREIAQADGARRGSYQRERLPSTSASGVAPDDLKKKLGRLSVAGLGGAGALGAMGAMDHKGGRPPASPLLEAYKGTYQSISPMPSPLALATIKKGDDDLSDLDLDSEDGLSDEDPIKRKIKQLEREKKQHLQHRDGDRHDSPRSSNQKLELREPESRSRASSEALSVISTTSSKKKKSVSFYDPENDAKAIAKALQGSHRSPDVKPLVKILPYLTTDELILLKTEYKNHAKINGQGINMTKHIKARITGNLGKVIYATALGQYESDAFWANCFYQSGASRRELLIESLVGRSNQQIREIKDVFKDKRYDDDLEQCMKAELKADKFRTAILLALEERRMPENLALDLRLVKEDVVDLYTALTNAGGESGMIKIIILRSDQHLREVMRVYEKTYHRNFARDMIEKSRNLVGETLAHMLNGALNRPMRDALLLHQAIAETAPGKERAELLISRVVRLHWDPKHLERVKAMYQSRYGMPVEVAIKKEVQANMKTEEGKAWTQFCIELVKSSDPSL